MVLRNFDPIWDEIYESGQQLNKYPYTTIVSFLSSQTKPFQNDGSRTKLLEIGCAPEIIFGLQRVKVTMLRE